jgi:peroxiredoxin
MRRLALPLVCLAAGLALAAGPYKVGDEVADATLSMADGKEARLSSFGGDATLLFFYSLSTRRAAEQAREVDQIRRGRGKKLAVVGIARDAKPEDVRKFADEHELRFPQAADPKSELYATYATKGIPWIAVVDDKRRLRYSAAGLDEEALDAELTKLLGPKAKDEGKK